MADITQAIEYAKKNPNSAFASELRRRMESGQMNSELTGAGLTQYIPQSVQPEKKKDGILKSVYKAVAEPVANLIARPGQAVQSALGYEPSTGKFLGLDITAPKTGKDVLADVGRGLETVALGVGGGAVKDIAKAGLKGVIKQGAVQGAKQGAIAGGMTGLGQGLEQEDVTVGDVVSRTVGGAVLGGATGGVLGGGVPAVGAVGAKVGQIAQKGANVAKNVVGGVYDATKLAAQGTARIPGRIATNVAEKKATQQAINSLPSTYAKKAVQDGIDIRDINILYSIPKEQKQVVSKLVKHVQDFEAGKSTIDPMESVGKPIVNRLKTLQSKQAVVGKKLGDIANTLTDEISEAQTFYPVIDNLRKVNGLQGLKLAEDGTLDFVDTVMSTAETSADRVALQSIFNDAIKRGTGKQKHLLRQELRESLGGKKRAGVQMTSTLDDAYEAVRKGLSDTLDTINPAYKAINQQYAKLANPVSELTKILKVGNETSDDVLNLSAGVLARRLTSASTGNAKIRQLLQLVDKATKVKGKTLTSTETLQNVINVLGRYYDIAPRTGFKNLTQEAVSGGVKDFVSGAVTDIAGRTDAVRKKALENVLKDSLSN